MLKHCKRNAVGHKAAAEALSKCILGALDHACCQTSNILAICMGLAGADTKQDEEAYAAMVRQLLPVSTRVLVCNDAVTALASGTGGILHGVVLIAGTGTIAMGLTQDGRQHRASGWGPAFMDSGSGYNLGCRALKIVAGAADGRLGPTALTQAVCEHAQAEDPQALIRWAYADSGWANIAALAPLLVTCAGQGDASAAAEMQDAVSDMVASVTAVTDRLAFTGSYPVVLAGGLLAPGYAYTEACAAALAAALPPDAEIAFPKTDAAVGAALLAARRDAAVQ